MSTTETRRRVQASKQYDWALYMAEHCAAKQDRYARRDYGRRNPYEMHTRQPIMLEGHWGRCYGCGPARDN
jgi:hypothetical protein